MAVLQAQSTTDDFLAFARVWQRFFKDRGPALLSFKQYLWRSLLKAAL